MYKYIFDVDGTLTPSRKRMNKKFAVWFSKFCETNNVYLVTGSDRTKTVEQIGEYIYFKCKRVYNCSGCDVYEGDQNIRTVTWKIPSNVISWLEDRLEESNFVLRTGLHIEERSGMLNFSIVGRNAILAERMLYIEWDKKYNERNHIVHDFNLRFPTLNATAGGETGIDIGPKGFDKSQILIDFNENDQLHFFGDAIFQGGNDWSIANKIVDQNRGTFYNVTDWQDTWEILKQITVLTTFYPAGLLKYGQ